AEESHLLSSFDCLGLFRAVDLYAHNIQATPGLLQVLREVQKLDGFGLNDHARSGLYSMCVVDVSIYWQLLRMYYGYSGMAPIRNDQILLLGLWHPYHYAHIALWHQFGGTFLGEIYFALFPDEKLKRRPPLTQSATLLGWLRLAHPRIKDLLVEQLEYLRKQMVEFDMKTFTNIQEVKGDDLPANPYRSRFIHLLNLNIMFEFCIPTIQDYGAALKLNDWEKFRKCYDRLFLFFSMCTTKGVADYQRTMYVHMILMDYWK